MDADLIVVGAGIVGSSVAREAQRRGLQTLVLESNPDAVLASRGLVVLRENWVEDKSTFHIALETYRELDALVRHIAQVTTWRRLEPKPQDNWYTVNAIRPLVKPKVALALSVGTGVVSTDRGDFTAPRIVIATGTSPTLNRSVPPDGSVTYACQWVANYQGWTGLRVHLPRPHFLVMAGPVDEGIIGLGSALGKDVESCRRRGMDMLKMAESLGMVPKGLAWESRIGPRIKSQQVGCLVKGVWFLGGMKRIGYTESPYMARKLLDEIAS